MNNRTAFEERELEILRDAVDKATKQMGEKVAQSNDVKDIIAILEDFLRKKETLCYGGTAVNNILPEQDRFYNRDIEIPDYDFFTPHAIEYARELAKIYFDRGYTEVEAKSGVHEGTYKVFVNFMPIADITYLEPTLFANLSKKAIKINAVSYCPPNYLRMAMYQELSRPMGDVTRWEKVLKRIILLNKNFPLHGVACAKKNFQRKFEGTKDDRDQIYDIARTSIINQGLVFFGGYAASLYGRYMPQKERRVIDTVPDFDILSEDPHASATILKEQLEYEGFGNVTIVKREPIGEYVDEHYEIKVHNDVIAFIYKANACHSYNMIYINGQRVKVATIDTMLTFYLIFIYANRPYYDEDRLLCMAEYLFKVQLKNRLQQKGLLRRFSINCYGKQKTLEDIRADKAKKFRELKARKLKSGDPEYDTHFLRYVPGEINKNTTVLRKDTVLTKEEKEKDITKKKKIKRNKGRIKKTVRRNESINPYLPYYQ